MANIKLSQSDIEEIRIKRQGGATLRTLGTMYNVSFMQISKVCRGMTKPSRKVIEFQESLEPWQLELENEALQMQMLEREIEAKGLRVR